ncbi:MULTISPECIES: zinc ribbon domain-containing protein [Lactobacillus]|uniref:Zinc-ribbon domain-containing protein n=1 Tax=Lactobacillus xujianguonis TaxID=2495899 RepID=A0A437ST79_9LACO|nr:MULTISPECIES: zinc-ribbon domain-containing protein [Lactobacillus]RVU70133.1 zinc-ribbon domain-containing protein [Lactobacillus xujianguonis]RVU73351.1 zinc-ribbon domain-containing protein [Lactobacillus xujianguonis]
MSTCPNCGKQVKDEADICPNCGFNLKKYRDDFFTDQHQPEKYEQAGEAGKIASRAAYREEFYPENQNSTVQKMIGWVRKNATIVFLLGVLLLIIMSFSRSLGWISFLVLMVWLFIVCDRATKIEQYTVDKRLTQKLNLVGSNVFNSVESNGQKLRSRRQRFEKDHPKVEDHLEKVKKQRTYRLGYIQLSVVLTAFISLIVLFSGSGASVMGAMYSEKMSISKVILSLAGRLLSSGNSSIWALVLYVIWLLLILFPIFIIYNIFKNTKPSQAVAFILSLIETIFLIFIIFKMSSSVRANTGVLSQVTSQLLTYAVSIGASAYFLVLASIMTTALSGFNVFRKNK